MTVSERFLYLFSVYRDALARAQRAEEQAMFDRSARDEAERKYDELVKRTLDQSEQREQQLMRVRYGNGIALSPEQIAAGMGAVTREKKEGAQSPREWRAEMAARANKDLDSFLAKAESGQLNDRIAS